MGIVLNEKMPMMFYTSFNQWLIPSSFVFGDSKGIVSHLYHLCVLLMAKLYNQNKIKRKCEHKISCEVRDNMELWKQGAEAKIHKTDFYGKPCIVKERFSKSYRHPILDKSLTAQRVKSEIRAMLRCRMSGMILIHVVVWALFCY